MTVHCMSPSEQNALPSYLLSLHKTDEPDAVYSIPWPNNRYKALSLPDASVKTGGLPSISSSNNLLNLQYLEIPESFEAHLYFLITGQFFCKGAVRMLCHPLRKFKI